MSVQIELETEAQPRSPWKDAWFKLSENRLAMIGLGGFLIMVSLCYASPLFYPHSPTFQTLSFGATPPLTMAIEVRYDAEAIEPDETITPKEFSDLYAENPASDVTRYQRDRFQKISQNPPIGYG
jgi:hypothetical protein